MERPPDNIVFTQAWVWFSLWRGIELTDSRTWASCRRGYRHAHQLLKHFCDTHLGQSWPGCGQFRAPLAVLGTHPSSSEHLTQVNEETFSIITIGLSCCATIGAKRETDVLLEWNNNVIPYRKILVWISDSVVLGVLQSSAMSCAEAGGTLLSSFPGQSQYSLLSLHNYLYVFFHSWKYWW